MSDDKDDFAVRTPERPQSNPEGEAARPKDGGPIDEDPFISIDDHFAPRQPSKPASPRD